jgi:Domain of Unknown Function (DUF928)
MSFSRFSRFVIVCGWPALFTAVTLAGLVATPVSAAPAVRKPRYVPRDNRQAPRRTEAGGTRGCSINAQAANIQLLVPTASHTGQTITDRPAFLWAIDNPQKVPLPLQFTLIEPGVLKPIYQQKLAAIQSGVMQLTLPAEAPALKADTAYRWMVSWSCDQTRPSEQLHRRAWIERVAPTTELTQSLQTAKMVPDRITAYAQAGLWQEAIDLAAAHRHDPQVEPLWQELLQDGALPSIN